MLRLGFREIAAPEGERAVEVALARGRVVDGQICHGKAVSGPRHPLHDATNALDLQLLTEAVDDLGGCRLIDLGEGEIELPPDAGYVQVRGVGTIGDQRTGVDAGG